MRIETLILWIVVPMVGVRIVMLILERLRRIPVPPDPWDNAENESLAAPDAVPVCHHCMAPQENTRWFCPNCGASVGPYNNSMPYIYIFSQGEVLRKGVDLRRRSPLVVTGYALLGLLMYGPLAPIYWFFLFKSLRSSEKPPDGAQPAADSTDGVS